MNFKRILSLPPHELFLRVGLAFAFLYPAIDAYRDPASWLGYFPAVVTNAFHIISIPLNWSDVVLLHLFGLLEIALALSILLSRRVRFTALFMAFLLLVIVLTNLDHSNFQVVFRDVSIALAALALASIKR